MNSPTVSVSVLTFQRPEMLTETLTGLVGLDVPDLEILVIDNSEDDRTEQLIAESFPTVIYRRTGFNSGVAGRNLGLAEASGEIVVTLDDDVTDLAAEDIAMIQTVFAADARLGALNFRVLNAHTGDVCNWCHHRKPEEDAQSFFLTYEISEGAVAIRKAAFAGTMGYPERFFIGHEGIDLAYQLMDAGFTVAYDGRVAVRHHHHQSGRPDWRRYYYDTRNHIWLAARHMPLGYAVRYLLIGLGSMLIYSIRDGYLTKWVSGLHAGIRGLRETLVDRAVWQPQTRALCREIDSKRPSFWYMVRKRLFRRGVSI